MEQIYNGELLIHNHFIYRLDYKHYPQVSTLLCFQTKTLIPTVIL